MIQQKNIQAIQHTISISTGQTRFTKNKFIKNPLSVCTSPSKVRGLWHSNTQLEILYSKILVINKTNSTMAQLTGLDSILEKSHYKTQRKNKYSFGKSQRFSSMKSTYTNDFFNVSSPRDTRTCSFGYGSKYFFNKPPNNPTGLEYNLPSQKHQGITFGVGRDKVKAGDYLSKNIIDKSPPSNTYDPNIESITKFARSSKYSMRKKQPSDSFIKPDLNPQPSKYNISLEKEGRVTVSNFKTSKKTVFSKSARFIEKLQNSLIGPGKYEPNKEASSKHRSSRKNVFAIAAKTTITEEAMKSRRSPGPIYYIP